MYLVIAPSRKIATLPPPGPSTSQTQPPYTTLTLLHFKGDSVGVKDIMEALVGGVIPLYLVGRKVHVGVADGVVDSDLPHLVIDIHTEVKCSQVTSGRGSWEKGLSPLIIAAN